MKRNCGVDSLKIVTMFMVVLIHILYRGGGMEYLTATSINYDFATLLEWLVQPAVDIFVLTTGYLHAQKKYSLSGIVQLYANVWFYSVVGTIVVAALGGRVDGKDWVNAFLPVLRDQYWFFTQYFALYLFIPILNCLLDRRKETKYVIIVGLMLFSLAPVLSISSDPFVGNYGFSCTWFVVLYLCGGYYKRYGATFIKRKLSCLAYLFLCVIGWGRGN